jgi:pimeloyl-ACP methyl ester carboxylesterase
MGVQAWAVGWCLVLIACTAADGDSGGDSADDTAVRTGPPTTLAEPTTTAPPTTAGTTSTTVAISTTLTDWTCPEGAPAGARCHRLDVPADWSDPSSSRISLPVVVLPANAPTRREDAIVIPAGGPGDRGLDGLRYWRESAIGQERDIVLYDQRGAGLAEPNLECPERDEAFVANLQRDEPFDIERGAIVTAFAACRERLEAAGIDVDDYDSEASVRDLDAIREALGYDTWNLLGISYGARLTLAAMRSAPEHLRSVILDSVYDVTAGGIAQTAIDAERAFQQLADGCAADPACAAAHPDVAATITAVNERYNAAPIVVDVDLEDGAGPRRFVITGDDALGGLFNALYDADLVPLLPSILDGLANGETGVVPELIRQGVAFATRASDGMSVSVNCADNGGLPQSADEEAVRHPGRTALLVTDVLCSEWPVEPTSESFNEPVVSDIPALVLAGLYDPVTPPAGTEAVAGHLTNATFGLWPNRGHGVTGEPCATTVELAFLADPTAPVDLSCLASVPGPAFA